MENESHDIPIISCINDPYIYIYACAQNIHYPKQRSLYEILPLFAGTMWVNIPAPWFACIHIKYLLVHQPGHGISGQWTIYR